MACYDLIKIGTEIGEVDEIYNADELELLRQQIEDVQEDHFLEDIYGLSSQIANLQWRKKLCGDAKWIFDTAEIRKRLFDAAEIEPRHI